LRYSEEKLSGVGHTWLFYISRKRCEFDIPFLRNKQGASRRKLNLDVVPVTRTGITRTDKGISPYTCRDETDLLCDHEKQKGNRQFR